MSAPILETRYVGGRFLYRLEGQAMWHTTKGDALNVPHRVIERHRDR
jgi:hypothetical protein